MRTLTLKLLALFLVITGLSIFTRVVVINPPPGWGEPRTALKWEQLLDLKPNLVFIGSSRVNNHFDPESIDPLLESEEIRSYNLGLPASGLSWSSYQVQELLSRNDEIGIHFILVEIAPFDTVAQNRMNNPGSRYWMSLWDVRDAVVSNYHTQGIKSSAATLGRNGSAYLRKVYNVELLSSQFHRKYKTPTFLSQLRDWDPNGRGFFSPEPLQDGKLIKSYEALRDDPSLLDEVVSAAQASSEQDGELAYPAVLDRCINLIHQAESANIRLIWMLPPRSKVNTGIYSVYNRLPEENRIDLDRADLHPELYTLRYSFDVGHMNREGVKLFSRFFADSFLQTLAR